MSEIQPWQNRQTDPRQPQPAVMSGAVEPEMRSWLGAWWPALAWAGFIFVMSTDSFSAQHTLWFFAPVIRWFAPSLNHAQIELIHHYIRKTAHFTEYFVFCSLIYRGIRGAHRGWRWTWGLAALAVAAGYSALDEIHQAFVSSREARISDSLLDSSGAFFAILVLWLWFRRRSTAQSR